MKVLLTCDIGFENVVLEEVKELAPSLAPYRVTNGRVFVECEERDLPRVLSSRTVNNVYAILGEFEGVRTLDDIYRVMKGIDFVNYIEADESFAVRPERVGRHEFTSIDIGRVAGQAVIDCYLSAKGVRPKVNLDEPDVEIYTELSVDRLTVAIAITRRSLHVRGYKVFNHPAALKSTIAAAMLRVAGWRPGEGVFDPMCGGGTIVVEAALTSKGVTPLCMAKHNVNERVLPRLGPQVHSEFVKALERCHRTEAAECPRAHVGVDINPRFVEGAIINAKNAGVDDVALFLVGDSAELAGKVKRLEVELGAPMTKAVFNPPYGHRMRPGPLYKLYLRVLTALSEAGFNTAAFITSATRVAEEVLVTLGKVSRVEKLKVIHGTLRSLVYRVDFQW